MIHEIRNYYIDPAGFAGYSHWAKHEAIDYLRRELKLVGFWLNGAQPCELRGEAHDKLGPANVTWIIAWDDIGKREATLATAFSTPEWNAIFAKLPGGLANYLRMESKFTEAIG